MAVEIVAERPDTVDAQCLIAELDGYLTPMYPNESRHGFSVDKLIREEVAFFVMRYNEELAGCGGVKSFPGDYAGGSYAEVKRMYVRPHLRGNGLAKRMLEHLTEHARQQQIHLLRLETGIYQVEAIGLYERMGFRRIGPFGEYRLDPLSIYYEKRI
jgi:ribosomal protein S18 acetylase RimI-like enzyme